MRGDGVEAGVIFSLAGGVEGVMWSARLMYFRSSTGIPCVRGAVRGGVWTPCPFFKLWSCCRLPRLRLRFPMGASSRDGRRNAGLASPRTPLARGFRQGHQVRSARLDVYFSGRTLN